VRLVLHIGAHGTDDGLIARWLAGNRTPLAEQGVLAPPPRVFLHRLGEALDRDRDQDPQVREEALLRGMGASGARRRLAVSAPGLLGAAQDMVGPEGFYAHDVARRMLALRTLFPRCRFSVLLAVRAPSGILPALLPQDPEAAAGRLSALGDGTLPWGQVVAALRRHLPGARLVVWRHEDLAWVWPDVLTELLGSGPVLPRPGLDAFAALGLSAEAAVRLRHYLAGNPARSAGQLRETAEVFATRFGRAVPHANGADLPGWMHEEFARLDAGYRTEWDDIANQTGVVALAPGV
jgi:hypothetical protein